MLVATALQIGISISDLDSITTGFLIDIMKAVGGDDGYETEQRYKKLKNIENLVEEQHRNGEISFKEYQDYKDALIQYERG